jgi:SAM-dependent methyltransferase
VSLDSTVRFSSRVDNYVRYRPGYPPAILNTLATECGLTPASVVADIGSGTGKLAEVFLDNGNRVLALEPNREMREAAERLLRGRSNFLSIAATAEFTTLDSGSVDFVAAGQAFHWFDRPAARNEFIRILKRGGWVTLVWNVRRTHASPFLADYQKLLERFGTEGKAITHEGIGDEILSAFFGVRGYQTATFDNLQRFGFDGLKGRLLSSSYMPNVGQSGYEPMIEDLSRLFAAHQDDGVVEFAYTTRMHFGRLT